MGQYKTGTISVNNGETTVTGTGTNWQAANIREGCVIEIAGQEKLIASLTDTTHLELSVPWSGANQVDVLYAIQYTSPDFGTNWGVSQQVMDVIDRLSSALGADGADGGLDFTASISTAGGDPGAGKVAGNNAVAASVTELTVSNTDANGAPGTDVSAWLDTLAGRSLLMIDKSDRSHLALFSVSAVVDSGGFRTLTVSHVAGGMGWADGANLLIQGSGPQGPQGAAGASILTGAGAPSDANGVDGDFYVNSSNADFYQKASGTWGSPLGNFAGSTGADGASVLSGSGVPSGVLGVDGDSYINVANGDTYGKAAGAWSLTGNIKGPQGDPGTDGLDGADGTDPGILLTWDDGTADANPGAGNVRADNADLSLAGFLYVSKTNRAANDISAWLAGLDDSTNPTKKAELVLTRSGGNAQAKFDLTAVTDATGYVKLAVSNHSGATGFILNNTVSLQAYPVGDKGLDGAGSGDVVGPASAVDSHFAAFDTTTGKLIKDSGKSAADFIPASYLDTDTALAANSDTKVATQKAVKAYADALLAANDAMIFKGAIDCSANPNYPAADAGQVYSVSVAGKIGGASGPNVEVGDSLLCIADGSASGTQAAVGSDWVIRQVNIDGAVVGPASVTDSYPALFDGASGKLIKAGTGPLGDAAYKNTGTAAGTLAAGDDSRITGATPAADLASTAGSKGASLVGVQDADGIYDAATVEAALAEAKRKLAGVNTQTGTTYTFVLTDAGKVVEANNASAVTFTVPPNSSVAFPLWTRIDLSQIGAGQLSVAAGAGVTIRSASGNLKLAHQYSMASLYKRASDEWVLVGNLTA